MSGPVTRALGSSQLATAIKGGLQAMGAYSGRVDGAIRRAFVDSIDLDEATRPAHPNDHRWDYLIGHATTSNVVGVEVHSAETSQVSVVIEKKKRSRTHLQPHLAAGTSVAAWYWVASGKVSFPTFDKQKIRLAQEGSAMVGSSLQAKHLASLQPARAAPRKPVR